jgi:hypothetical protein
LPHWRRANRATLISQRSALQTVSVPNGRSSPNDAGWQI